MHAALRLRDCERGRRLVRPSISYDEIIAAVTGGDRLEILVALNHCPLSVGAIQKIIGARSMSHVTAELLHLQEFGIVTWDRDKTSHIYRLTERLRIYTEDGMVQIQIRTAAGHWAIFHVDEDGNGRTVEPPDFFLDASRPWPRQHATSGSRHDHAPASLSRSPESTARRKRVPGRRSSSR